MSLYFGMLALHESGHDGDHLSAASALFETYPGEPIRRWQDAHSGLLYRAQCNTPQSVFESQPLEYTDDTESYCLVADARVDNREELFVELAEHPLLAGRALEEVGDDRILLASFLMWGESAPARLLGDFSFVVYSRNARTVFLARDHLGVKNLYFARQGPWLFVANIPDVFAVLPDFDTALSAQSLAGYIATGALLDKRRTFYTGVSRLPSGSFSVISGASAHETRYWRPEECPELDFESVADAAQALRKLLENAVEDRLKTDYPVGTHLSGGLDSAAVSYMASRLIAEPGARLTGFSWVSVAKNGQDFTEWTNAQRLAEQFGIPIVGLRLTSDDVQNQLHTMDIARLDTSDAWYESKLLVKASGEGIRTLLSGWGGDELISYAGRRAVVEQFLSMKFAWVYRELRASGDSITSLPRTFVKSVIYPLVSKVRASVTSPGFAEAGRELSAYHPAIRKAQDWKRWVYPGQALSVRAEQLALLAQGHLQVRMESWANAGKRHGVDYRYPLLDKRLVEFALGLSADFYQRLGVGRWLFREALRDDLPDWLIEGEWKFEPQRVSELLQAVSEAARCWHEPAKESACRACLDDGIPAISEQQLLERLASLEESGPHDRKTRVLHVQSVLSAILVSRTACTHGGSD